MAADFLQKQPTRLYAASQRPLGVYILGMNPNRRQVVFAGQI
jgi:hypothetical protein